MNKMKKNGSTWNMHKPLINVNLFSINASTPVSSGLFLHEHADNEMPIFIFNIKRKEKDV